MRALTKATALLAGALVLASTGMAHAQPRRGGRVVIAGGYFHSPFFYDPFWDPYYGYGFYPYGARADADVRVDVTPKQAEVYVDGYYAGLADDFAGVFKHLHTTPGGHAITLHLEGYRTSRRASTCLPMRPSSCATRWRGWPLAKRASNRRCQRVRSGAHHPGDPTGRRRNNRTLERYPRGREPRREVSGVHLMLAGGNDETHGWIGDRGSACVGCGDRAGAGL